MLNFSLNKYFEEKKLNNISDPEKKRKIIGNTFIKLFENFTKNYKGIKILAQGTLYPDLIESKSVTGSQTSKMIFIK